MQLAVDTSHQLVIGVSVSNVGSDKGKLLPMLEQLKTDLGRRPEEHLVDGGYVSTGDVVAATRAGVRVLMPPRKPTSGNRGRYEPTAKDPPEVAEWRRRMGTDEAQVAYRRRASTVECVNGTMKNRGLGKLLVRGLERVRAVAALHAIAHNLGRAMRLGSRPVATT